MGPHWRNSFHNRCGCARESAARRQEEKAAAATAAAATAAAATAVTIRCLRTNATVVRLAKFAASNAIWRNTWHFVQQCFVFALHVNAKIYLSLHYHIEWSLLPDV